LYSLGDKDGRGVDVHRLITQLKAMGETTLVDKLESSVRATVNASVEYSRGMNASVDHLRGITQPQVDTTPPSSSSG